MLDKIATMPPLPHSTDGLFDITKSEATRWLVAQPEVMSWVFETVRNMGAIVYNPETGMWSGSGTPVKPSAVFTPEELFDVLKKHERLTFATWKHICETRYNKQCGLWNFVRPIQVLMERGIVFKIGKNYQTATAKSD